MNRNNWFIRHKVWSIIIALLIIFSISIFFLTKNSEQTDLTGKVIGGSQNASEQIDTQGQETSYQQEDNQANNQQAEQIEEEQNQEKTKTCEVGYLEEYKCNGSWRQKKWQYLSCSTEWKNFEDCPYGCSNSKCNSKPEEQLNYFKVTRVIDGDTIEISTGQRVRLICIDTPETGENYYQEAKNYLTNLILNKEVGLVKDISETDKYGRLLRYIYFENDFVNELIVLNGYGKAYPYSPDTKLCPQIQEAEQKARSQEIGIWAVEEEETPPNNSGYICSYNAYNCDDFSTHAQAQAVFEACGGVDNDIHRLDGDKDGLACESLP